MGKIAILTERLKTGFGVDLVVHQQARRLVNNHELAVLAVDIDHDFVSAANYSVYQLHIPLHFNPIRQDIATKKNFARYKRILSGFDTFIIQTPTFNSWIGNLAKLGKVITYYHGNSPSFGLRGIHRYRKQLFDFMENNLYFRHSDKIVSISGFLKAGLPQNIQSKTVVSYSGREHILETYSKISKSALHRIWDLFDIRAGEKIITYIGRLDYKSNPYKNTHDLIDLRKALSVSKNPKVKIVAIGFPQRGIEKELYRSGICVVPRATQEELVALLSRSYIYFSPTLWEGFNLPFLEAQTLGVPVVGYKVGAHSEVVSDGKSGFLVNDFKEATTKIQYLLSHPELRSEMSENAARFSKNFSWDNNVKLLENLI